MKLNKKAFAIACGLIWGFGIFLVTWWMIAFEGVGASATSLSKLYRGYTITPSGSLVGFAWGFANGGFVGFVLSSLYNHFIPKPGVEAAAANEREREETQANEEPRALLK